MNELTAAQDTDELALRDVIRKLGSILGETLAELYGQGALEAVEGLRRSAVALRKGELPGGRAAFARGIEARPTGDLARMAESFAHLFQLINTAEEAHRARILRARDREGGPVDGSVAAAVVELGASGAGPAEVQELLDRMLVMPVLTAHPTEARRRTVLDHLSQVARALDRLDDPRAGARERAREEVRLREVVTALAATHAGRTERPSPLDEVQAGLLHFERTLLDAVPAVYRELERALEERWPGAGLRVPPFLRFGTWIGGDRDGNPFVTAAVTRAALERQRAVALSRYLADVQRLSRALSPARIGDPSALEKLESSIAADRDALRVPGLSAGLRSDERWREKLRWMSARLAAARVRGEGGYPDAAAYVADLALLQRTLTSQGLGRLAEGELEEARRRAEVFGFHLASLDVRQHSGVHERAVDEILAQAGLPGYAELHEEARLAVLTEGLQRPSLSGAERARLGPEAREAVETLRVVGWARRDLGPEACERYVVSFTAATSDLLEVLFLARAAGLAADEIRPVPLLEQLQDLAAGPEIAQRALSIAPLRAAFRGELEVMVGYSDSCKQVGYVPSQVALHKAQLALAQVAEAEGVMLTIFHGRGGAVGRGGGPANRAIRAQPRPALRGRFRVTEQGETIATRYGREEIARRDLEQMVNAVLVASAGPMAPAADDATRSLEGSLDEAAGAALGAYRALTADPGRLARYALAATPLAEIPELRLASRPSSRSGQLALESLRAIPWVFSWNQSRHGLPGWYGLGSGLEALVKELGEAGAREAYRGWPLLRGLVDNARLALTQADIDVAACYAELASPEDRGLFQFVREEHARTVRLLLAVTGDSTLLGPWPTLARAAERRNPYIDVLSHIQIALLRRLREAKAGGEEAAALHEAISLTMNGIAAGLQTVG